MIEDEASPELTGQGVFVGTPFYMSPEQIRGGISKDGRGEIDGRSDLYSVGVLLYQLLTGRLPFSARNNMEVLAAHLHQTPLPMKEANPAAKVPPAVEKVVMSCLERDPDRRPQSARELAERFQAAMGGTSKTAELEPAPLVGRARRLRLATASSWRHPGHGASDRRPGRILATARTRHSGCPVRLENRTRLPRRLTSPSLVPKPEVPSAISHFITPDSRRLPRR